MSFFSIIISLIITIYSNIQMKRFSLWLIAYSQSQFLRFIFVFVFSLLTSNFCFRCVCCLFFWMPANSHLVHNFTLTEYVQKPRKHKCICNLLVNPCKHFNMQTKYVHRFMFIVRARPRIGQLNNRFYKFFSIFQFLFFLLSMNFQHFQFAHVVWTDNLIHLFKRDWKGHIASKISKSDIDFFLYI